jgi:hypothetical protein
MPLMRRRPLLRAAMVGGSAYAAGKHVQRNQQHESAQDQEIAGMQGQQAPPPQAQYQPPPPPAPAPASAADRVKALSDLKGLLDAGVLTQGEFEVEKQKILQGG